jgi:PIN domain nuclease of toxin-antitoxin system
LDTHVLLAGRLPPHHDDPFDRVLIAQAMMEELTLVTHDKKRILYDVSTMAA